MAAKSRHPNQIVIMVSVTFPLGPLYTYQNYGDKTDATSPGVAPGDQICWFVKVQTGSGWSQPPYTLTFANPSIFGTASISIPNGGSSGFLTVQALSGSTKYTLSVGGIVPVSDPQIVVDPNGTLGPLAAGQQYNVRWTVASNVMDLSVAGVWTPFPPAGLQVAFNDKVQFFAVLTPPADFEIDFPSTMNPTNLWDSPFDPGSYQFPAVNHGAANENSANLTVIDKNDPAGTAFKFMASLTDGSVQSAAYILILA